MSEMTRGTPVQEEQSEPQPDLRQHLLNAFGLPEHLKMALHAWVESVESRLGSGSMKVESGATDLETFLKRMEAFETRFEGRLEAVERLATELHTALLSSPSPKSVQTAVAEVPVLTGNESNEPKESSTTES